MSRTYRNLQIFSIALGVLLSMYYTALVLAVVFAGYKPGSLTITISIAITAWYFIQDTYRRIEDLESGI